MNPARIAAALRELAAAIEEAPEDKPSRPRRRRERLPPPPSREPSEEDLADADRFLQSKGWKP